MASATAAMIQGAAGESERNRLKAMPRFQAKTRSKNEVMGILCGGSMSTSRIHHLLT